MYRGKLVAFLSAAAVVLAPLTIAVSTAAADTAPPGAMVLVLDASGTSLPTGATAAVSPLTHSVVIKNSGVIKNSVVIKKFVVSTNFLITVARVG
jgi:hypothetical protein